MPSRAPSWSWSGSAARAADTTIDDLAQGLATACRLVQHGGRSSCCRRQRGRSGRRCAGSWTWTIPGMARPPSAATRVTTTFWSRAGSPRRSRWADVFVLSRLDRDLVDELSLVALENPEQARRLAAASGSCSFVSHAELTRAVVRAGDREVAKMMTASEFEAITTAAGLVDRSDRVRLEISGPDRAKFLHNLTTNEVKRLAVGRGCEAFVTSPQGKTIGYRDPARGRRPDHRASRPWRRSSWSLPHFRKYGVFDDVSIDDRPPTTFELHLFGPEAGESGATGRGPAARRHGLRAHREPRSAGCPVRVIRESPTGRPGLTVIGRAGRAERVARMTCCDLGRDLGLVTSTPRPSRSCASKPAHRSSARTSGREKPAAGDRPRRPGDQFRQGMLPGPGDRRSHRCARARQPDLEGALCFEPGSRGPQPGWLVGQRQAGRR